MLAQKIARPPTKAAAGAANTLALQRPSHVARPVGSGAGAAVKAWDFSHIPLFPPDRLNQAQAPSAFARSSLPASIQAKLAMDRVDDPLEHQADHIADQVTRLPAAEISIAPVMPRISRKCASCGDEESKMLQQKPAGPTKAAGAEGPGSVHEALRSPGQPLDAPTRAYFEPRFGHDFSDVRVHTDAPAQRSARDLQAHAYTVGHDVVFGARRFAPQTLEGRRLIAHELTHVLQQREGAARVQMQFQKAPDAQKQRSTPAGPNLDELAKWPDEALRSWPTLDASQRVLVTLAIAKRYGVEFAETFQAEAGLRRHKESVHYYYGPGLDWITPKGLSRRDFRLAKRDSLHEWWVHPRGDTLTRRWDRTERTPDPASKDVAPPVQETQPKRPTPEAPPSAPMPPSADACKDIKLLGEAICDNAGRICRIADELKDDAAARASCARAESTCNEAKKRTAVCAPPALS